jgi:hypothetical protein
MFASSRMDSHHQRLTVSRQLSFSSWWHSVVHGFTQRLSFIDIIFGDFLMDKAGDSSTTSFLSIFSIIDSPLFTFWD